MKLLKQPSPIQPTAYGSRDRRTDSEADKLFRLSPTYLVWPSVNSPVSTCHNSPWPLLPVRPSTNPSTIYLVIVVTDPPTHTHTHTHTHTQTDTQTNAGKTYSLSFAGRIRRTNRHTHSGPSCIRTTQAVGNNELSVLIGSHSCCVCSGASLVHGSPSSKVSWTQPRAKLLAWKKRNQSWQ